MTTGQRHRTLLLLVCAASLSAGCKESDSAPISGPDLQPPLMLWLIGPDEPVNPGDSILIRFYAQDNVGIEHLTIRVNGAFELDDSFELEEPMAQLTAIVNVPVPEGVRIDIPVTVTLGVVDGAGHTTERTTEVQLIDSRVPLVRLNLGGLRPDGTIGSGDNLLINVSAADNHRLGYVGFSGAGLRDSVPTSSLADAHTFRVTVPPAWVFQRPAVTAWARDAAGHLTTSTPRNVEVYNWVEHPVATIAVPHDLWTDVQFDAKRRVLYRLRYLYSAIDVIDVRATRAPASISLPGLARSVAFSASGDSLVLTLPGERALGIIDLLNQNLTTSTVPLRYEDQANREPFALQASGQHLFVTLSAQSDWGQLLDVNLSTGSQVIRTDIDGGSRVASLPILLPLPNARLFVGAHSGSDFHEYFLYSADSDRFTRTSWLGTIDPKAFVPSPSGRYVAARGVVFDAALDSVASVPTWDWSLSRVMALSHDDQAVYQTTDYGYQKVRLSDGLLLEQVKLGMRPLRLIASADGSLLIAIGESTVMVVDLR